MSTNNIKITAGLAMALWLCMFSFSTAKAAPMHEACKSDIENYCGKITPGGGRIMACIYAHEEHISDACDEATSDMTDILDAVLGTVGDAIAICLPDIKEHCGDTKFGGGRIITCLSENKSDLNKDCQDIVSQFTGQLLE